MFEMYNEDCLVGMKKIPDKSVDMILCDLPYGQTKNNWDTPIPFAPLWEQFKRVAKDNAAIVLFGNGMFTAKLMESNPEMWRYNLIWEKTQPSGFLNSGRMPLRAHEDICVFYKKQPIYNPQKTTGHKRRVSKSEHKRNSKKSDDYGNYNQFVSYDSTERYPRSVLKFAKDTQICNLHGTQKPVKLCEWFIRTYTNEGMVVLDATMGSGTTAIAALNTNRKFIGFEKDTDIFGTAVYRLNTALTA